MSPQVTDHHPDVTAPATFRGEEGGSGSCVPGESILGDVKELQ